MQNIFLVTLTILVGLLWAGTIDAEMKWTATMFGLALMALIFNTGMQVRPHKHR